MQLEGEGGGSCFLQWLQTSYLAVILINITIPGCLSPQDIEALFCSWQIAVPGERLEEERFADCWNFDGRFIDCWLFRNFNGRFVDDDLICFISLLLQNYYQLVSFFELLLEI